MHAVLFFDLSVMLSVTMLSTVASQELENFPPPTFQSDWRKISTRHGTDFHTIAHRLWEVPVLVKVLVKATDGKNKDFVFEATGLGQTDDDEDIERGGVMFTYTDRVVYVFSAIHTNNHDETYNIYVAGSWGSGSHPQRSTDAKFQVLAWSSDGFYAPDFTSKPKILYLSEYAEIYHGLEELPALVQLRGAFNREGETWYFEGSGSQQNKQVRFFPGEDSAGLMFAYSDTRVRIWTGHKQLFQTDDGYSKEKGEMEIESAEVVFKAWLPFKGLRPVYNSDWFGVDQSEVTFHEMEFTGCTSVRHVNVEVLATDGNNKGFVFPGVGLAQSPGPRANGDEIGGAVFAYTEGKVRLWIMDNKMSPASGVIAVGWGDGTNQQLSSKGRVRIRLWCGDMTGMFRVEPNVRRPSCQHFEWFDASSARSALVKLGSRDVMSLSQCLLSCKGNHVCTAVSLLGTECHLYGDHQTGKRAEVDKDIKVLRMTGKSCDPCGEH